MPISTFQVEQSFAYENYYYYVYFVALRIPPCIVLAVISIM